MLIYLSTFTLVYSCLLAILIGAVLGSFLNCTAYRIAKGEKYARGRSHCPSCGHVLGVFDLIPILSWVALGGKCRYCKKTISRRYPLTELIMALLSMLLLLRCDISVLYVRNLIFTSSLFCLSLVDLDVYEIPDVAHLFSILAWLGTLWLLPDPIQNLKNGILGGFLIGTGVLIISIIFDKILGKETMGGGDIKLLFVSGLYLGPVAGLFGLILSCIVGIVFAVIRFGEQKNEILESKIPFGPAIAVATWIMLVYGNTFTQWYLGLIFR